MAICNFRTISGALRGPNREHARHLAVSLATLAGFLELLVVSWSRRFDEPIVLEDATTLRTQAHSIQYLADTVPKAKQTHEKVLVATDHLTRSAEQNYPMYFARAATMQAIHRNKERVFNPDRKDHHWGKRKLKRDQ
jgi:hypothetical protein